MNKTEVEEYGTAAHVIVSYREGNQLNEVKGIINEITEDMALIEKDIHEYGTWDFVWIDLKDVEKINEVE